LEGRNCMSFPCFAASKRMRPVPECQMRWSVLNKATGPGAWSRYEHRSNISVFRCKIAETRIRTPKNREGSLPEPRRTARSTRRKPGHAPNDDPIIAKETATHPEGRPDYREGKVRTGYMGLCGQIEDHWIFAKNLFRRARRGPARNCTDRSPACGTTRRCRPWAPV
jgi:hypothetical protein